MNKIDLNGRGAIITGGARGIGLAIAQRFKASGAKVSLWDMDPDALARVGGQDGFHGARVDVTDEAEVERGLRESVAALGRVDILVNNAGITGPNATTWEYPVADWRKVIEVDLTGVFLGCRAVVPHMLESGYGRIINIASVAGKEGNPNAPAYSAAKAGVIGLTKSLGKELAKTDIRVNCVTPAAAKTEIFNQMTEEFIGYMLSKIPAGRFVEIEEVAALVAWLASEDCSFSTGATFDISGGRATY
jgi:3-oxoacyl-[acyl-carrier protein] reductase